MTRQCILDMYALRFSCYHAVMRPYSETFKEHYWAGGPAEKDFVFLQGNSLPQRMAGAATFTVAELGFGTALNFLLTWCLWQQTAPVNARLTYISYELEPLTPAEFQTIHATFPPHLHGLSGQFLAAATFLPGWNEITLPQATLWLYIGAAQTGIATQPETADAWFLDGFSPARNPDMWSPSLLQAVATLTTAGGTFATYSAVGNVRRGLQAVGFNVRRIEGFPPKWHMLVGSKGGG